MRDFIWVGFVIYGAWVGLVAGAVLTSGGKTTTESDTTSVIINKLNRVRVMD